MKQEDVLKQPFFAQLLENQRPVEENFLPYPGTSPLKDPYTNKYPSDGDDDIFPPGPF